MEQTKEQLETDLEYYQAMYKRYKKENRGGRWLEGAQENIDRTYDKLKELKR